MCACLCTSVHVYVCKRAYGCVCVCLCMGVHVYKRVYGCVCVCVFRGTSTTPEVLHPLLAGCLGQACGAPRPVECPVNTEAWGLSLWRWALSLQLGGATCCLHSTQFRTLHDCPLVVLPVSSAWPTLPCPPGPSTWPLMLNSLSFCPSVVAWSLLTRGHHCHSFSPCWDTPSNLTCSLHCLGLCSPLSYLTQQSHHVPSSEQRGRGA